METQRILMRSLAVVFIASVIWTITVSAHSKEKVYTCCTAVSTVELTDPVIGFRMQKQNLPCLMAIIFQTERGEFCCDPRKFWVQNKVMQFMRAQINKSQTSTPPPASSISEHTHVTGSTQSTESS
ncbi:eotaxin-like [Megalobrama amblycephala]|uniref:eotaxin-like n=1 Tax=Megalobrama amblycephala TaxID=75352 RepID=UPI0020146D33|nr:eotaxin-like [Megalobrama amblycephala]